MRDIINLLETEILDEAGAGPARINTHIHNGEPFFVISACRANLSPEENAKRTALLKKSLAKNPALGFIEVIGKFHEAGQEYPSLENSFFVLRKSRKTNPDHFIDFGERLMQIFYQEAILFGKDDMIYLKAQGEEPMPLGDAVSFRAEVTDNAIGSTEIKGRSFSVVDKDPLATGYGAGKNQKKSSVWGCKMLDDLPVHAITKG